MPHRSRPILRASLVALALAGPLAGAPPPLPGFPVSFTPLPGSPPSRVREASVAAGELRADLAGKEFVVGASDGAVRAFRSNGVALWTYPTGGMAIESKPAIADVDGDGLAEVVVSFGSTFSESTSKPGGVVVLDHLGNEQCTFVPRDTKDNDLADGVFSSPAVADLDGNDGGKLEIVFGSWDFYVYALHDNCSVYWEKLVHDTVWSSPAIGDLDRDGFPEVVIGTDTNDNGPSGPHQGGRVYAFEANGVVMPGFPVDVDEVVWSSPALADLDDDSYLDIVVGTGYCWDLASCAPLGVTHPVTEAVWAFDRQGQELTGWPYILPAGEYARASPAVGDLDGDGTLEVVVNTISKAGGEGQVYALEENGTLRAGWPVQPATPSGCAGTQSLDTSGSPILVDLESDGSLEVLLVSTWEIVVWDADGVQLSRSSACPDAPAFTMVAEHSLLSTPTATDLDGDGALDLLIGGARSGGTTGAVYGWELTGDTVGAWPELRKDRVNSAVQPRLLFVDGFESEDLTAWSAHSP